MPQALFDQMNWIRPVMIVLYAVFIALVALQFAPYVQTFSWKEFGILDVAVWIVMGALVVLFGWVALGPWIHRRVDREGT